MQIIWWTRRQLRSKDEETRLTAIRKLQDLKHPKLIEFIRPVLKDESPLVRKGAINILKAIGSKEAVELIITFLSDQSNDIKLKSIEALKIIGDVRAVDLLVELALKKLTYHDYHIQVASIEALRTIGDARAVEPLVELLFHGYLAKSVISTFDAIEPAWRNSIRIIDKIDLVFSSLINSENFNVTRLISLTKDIDTKSNVRCERQLTDKVILLLKSFKLKGVSYKRDYLKDSRAWYSFNNDIINQLSKFKTFAVTPLIDWLKVTNSEIQNQQNEEIEEKYDVVIKTFLQLEDPGIIKRLGSLNDKRAIAPLILTIVNGKKRGVPEDAYQALAEIDSEWSSSVFAKETIPLLIGLCKESINNGVWDTIEAIKLLGKIRDKRAIAPLILIIVSRDLSDVAKSAHQALKEIDPEWSSSVFAKDTIPLLMEYGKNEKINWQNGEAISLLLEIGDENNVVSLLIPALENNKESVRQSAISGLVNIFGTKVLKPLAYKLLDSGGIVRDSIERTLKWIDKEWMRSREIKEIIPDLKKELRSHNSFIRKSAAELLCLFGWEPEDNHFATLNFVSLQKWEEIANMKSPDLDALFVILECENHSIIEEGIKIFAKIGNENPVVVVDFLKLKLFDNDIYVKWASAEVLIDLENSDVKKLLPTFILELFETFGNRIPSFFNNEKRLYKFSRVCGIHLYLISEAIQALGYEKYDSGNSKHSDENVSLEKSNNALQSISKSDSLFASCMLKLISNKQDVTISLANCASLVQYTIDFSKQRGIAFGELEKRGFKDKDPVEVFKTMAMK